VRRWRLHRRGRIRCELVKGSFDVVKPREDVRTFNRWMAAGLRPMEGSHSLKVGKLRLFHRSQCRPITAVDKQAVNDQSEAAIARHDTGKAKGAKVVPINASPQ
jgi:hypothetical protein